MKWYWRNDDNDDNDVVKMCNESDWRWWQWEEVMKWNEEEDEMIPMMKWQCVKKPLLLMIMSVIVMTNDY